MIISDHPHKTAESTGEFEPAPARQRSLKGIGLVLAISSVAFLVLVIWQRDHRIRRDGMAWAEAVAVEIRDHLAARGTLPGRLTDQVAQRQSLTVPYPAGPQLPIAQAALEPLVLVAGPRLGLIQPGGDGCAAVRIVQGKIETVWLSWDQAKQARELRGELLPDS